VVATILKYPSAHEFTKNCPECKEEGWHDAHTDSCEDRGPNAPGAVLLSDPDCSQFPRLAFKQAREYQQKRQKGGLLEVFCVAQPDHVQHDAGEAETERTAQGCKPGFVLGRVTLGYLQAEGPEASATLELETQCDRVEHKHPHIVVTRVHEFLSELVVNGRDEESDQSDAPVPNPHPVLRVQVGS